MTEPMDATLLGFAESLVDAELLKKKAQEMGGITIFDMNVPTGGMFAKDRLKSWIKSETDKWNLASFH